MLERVMVIDDNDADLVYTEAVLRLRGVAREVVCFDTAEAALRWLADPAHPTVSLALLDLNMPELDGFAFLKAAEALPGMPPVVVLTSSPEPTDRQRALTHRLVREYMVKPLTDSDADAMLRLARG